MPAKPGHTRGLTFDLGLYPTEDVHSLVPVVQRAEALRLDTLWLGDSPLIWREPFVTLGYLANHTRLRLGTGVTNCSSRNVAVLASAMATLNEASGGRAVMGIGVGDTALRTVGQQPARLRDLRESVAVMRTLWAGDSAIVNGRSVRLWSAPTHIPVYVSGSGPKTLELAGEIGDGAIFPVGVAPECIAAARECVARGAQRADRAPDDVELVCWSVLSVDEDEDRAIDGARPFVASILRHPLPYELADEDRAVAERIQAGYDLFQHMQPGAEHRDLVPSSTVRRFALAGTPDVVVRQVQSLGDAGIHRVALVILGPAWEQALDLFGREVLPKFPRTDDVYTKL